MTSAQPIAGVSCWSCRSLKRRCDKKRPECGSCVRYRKTCTYVPPPKQMAEVNHQLSDLVQRLDILDEKIGMVRDRTMSLLLEASGEEDIPDLYPDYTSDSDDSTQENTPAFDIPKEQSKAVVTQLRPLDESFIPHPQAFHITHNEQGLSIDLNLGHMKDFNRFLESLAKTSGDRDEKARYEDKEEVTVKVDAQLLIHSLKDRLQESNRRNELDHFVHYLYKRPVGLEGPQELSGISDARSVLRLCLDAHFHCPGAQYPFISECKVYGLLNSLGDVMDNFCLVSLGAANARHAFSLHATLSNRDKASPTPRAIAYYMYRCAQKLFRDVFDQPELLTVAGLLLMDRYENFFPDKSSDNHLYHRLAVRMAHAIPDFFGFTKITKSDPEDVHETKRDRLRLALYLWVRDSVIWGRDTSHPVLATVCPGYRWTEHLYNGPEDRLSWIFFDRVVRIAHLALQFAQDMFKFRGNLPVPRMLFFLRCLDDWYDSQPDQFKLGDEYRNKNAALGPSTPQEMMAKFNRRLYPHKLLQQAMYMQGIYWSMKFALARSFFPIQGIDASTPSLHRQSFANCYHYVKQLYQLLWTVVVYGIHELDETSMCNFFEAASRCLRDIVSNPRNWEPVLVQNAHQWLCFERDAVKQSINYKVGFENWHAYYDDLNRFLEEYEAGAGNCPLYTIS
ncbi:hypothetical protein BZG36_04696 [Bifiguratus adelaidae]|uniref:Zn(2)-C6 fungal-type domain-containing protein n=1 Tax=Bifiguratus adelaidae TaxID=1938954 RepID=A0A261XV86_9FUNG|nr:hypothetical protein BZG36_04696 [Bifiguratus adelaidae]